MKRTTTLPPEAKLAAANGSHIKAVDFQVINFYDEKAVGPEGVIGREIILLYALGEDGVVREFAGGKWSPLPIYE